ncbi:MAG TPA: prolyl oligopeptidase family serine peptidase [Chloroflexota bacterium]|nr:prolyl oligopeptidase family serine peptidase [Chloroflexota bacterium]
MTTAPSSPPGYWPSPISPEMVAEGGRSFGDLQVDGEDIYWSEGRPLEEGRYVIVRYRDGHIEDVLAPPWSARTFVHEYGGGAFTVHRGTIIFSNGGDGGLYRLDPGAREPAPICAIEGLRFADMAVDANRGRVIAVIEDHRGTEVRNFIGAVPLAGGEPTTLLEGNDFYSNPRLSPRGDQLAWITFNVPNMPWDDTMLYRSSLDEAGMPEEPVLVAGGEGESVMTPLWDGAADLNFISDRTNWWGIYTERNGDQVPRLVTEAECALPAWIFGRASYCFLDDGRLVAGVGKDGVWRLAVVESDGTIRFLTLPFTEIGALACRGSEAVMLTAGPTYADSVVLTDVDRNGFTILQSAVDVAVDTDYISAGEPVTFASGTESAHALYYPPRNGQEALAPGALPPLVAHAHGGPTSAASNGLDLRVQFWTSRGFAFLDVDYRGSTGYGRRYRQALYGNWGVVDIEDTLNAARHLADRGLVDGRHMFVTGGSAGGYVALMAVCGHDVFAGCTSYFGVTDLVPFAGDTHKFEAHYTDLLLGPLPECESVYRERSPVQLVDGIDVPVLLLQGLDDHVVPPSQAEEMRDALIRRGIPCEYIPFEGEGHGFRRAGSIIASYKAELDFYRRIISGDLHT